MGSISDLTAVHDGADFYVVGDGFIVARTIHYTVASGASTTR
jgi:hypothetical protein